MKSTDPLLLLFSVGENGSERSAEERFAAELRLALDDFVIHLIEPENEGFVRASTSEQIEMIRPLVSRTGAIATMWIEKGNDTLFLLHLVALDTGRALVRIVEVAQNPQMEAELALVAGELLGEAFLFNARKDPAIDRVALATRERIVPSIEPIEEPPWKPAAEAIPVAAEAAREEPERRSWGVMPLAGLGGGVYDHVGPSLRWGAGVAVEAGIARGLIARLAVSVDMGPREHTRDMDINEWGVRPDLALGYRWRLKRLGLGPLIGLAIPWSRLDIALGKGSLHSFSGWKLRGYLGVDSHLALSERIGVVIDGAIGIVGPRDINRRESDARVVLATPLVDWSVIFGLLVRID